MDWALLVWVDWRSALVIVKPETVIAWHRKGVSYVLDLESPSRQAPAPSRFTGHSRTDPPHEPRESRLGSTAHHGELLKLGIDIGETSVIDDESVNTE